MSLRHRETCPVGPGPGQWCLSCVKSHHATVCGGGRFELRTQSHTSVQGSGSIPVPEGSLPGHPGHAQPGVNITEPFGTMCKTGLRSLPQKAACSTVVSVWERLPPHSLSAMADTSSCSARISLASRVRYWQRCSSCCSAVAMRRERLCRQFITDGSALACSREATRNSNTECTLR